MQGRFGICELNELIGVDRALQLFMDGERIALRQLLQRTRQTLLAAQTFIDITEKLIQLRKNGVTHGKIAIVGCRSDFPNYGNWTQCFSKIEGYSESFVFEH